MRKTVLTVAASMIVTATIAAVATWLIVDGGGETAVSDQSEPQEISAFESAVFDSKFFGLATPITVVCRATNGEVAAEGTTPTRVRSGNGQTSFCNVSRAGQITAPVLVESDGEWIAVSYVNGIEHKVRVNP